MGPTTATLSRDKTDDSEQVNLGNSLAAVRWTLGAELTLFDRAGARTRVVGGPLIELLDPERRGRPATIGLARETDENFAVGPDHVADALGTGLLVRRRFPVAVQPLVADLGIAVYDHEPWVCLTMRLVNEGPEPITINRIFPFVAGRAWGDQPMMLHGRERDFAVYKQGWQSWSHTAGMPPGSVDPRPRQRTTTLWHHPGGATPTEPLGGGAEVVADGLALVGGAHDQSALLAGFVAADHHFGQIYVDRQRGALTTAALLDGMTLGPGEAVETDPLLIALGRPEELLECYAEAVARWNEARSATRTQTGWCSWYYYFTGVSEADVLENVAALRSARGVAPVSVVQIDDGYQRAVGDWTSINERFPSGMDTLAQRIRDAGFRPGLWLAPFTAAADSQLAIQHPEWMVQDDHGRPAEAGTNWDRTLYGLDTTHPGAREWLRSLFATVVERWGYDYLKLDFLVTAALPGRRFRPVTRAAALREGLELVREVVGNDVYLLGCGCPLLSGVGPLDAMRIGTDVATEWTSSRGAASAETNTYPGAAGAMRNTLLRAWMHPTLWANDPDCLLAREARSSLTLDEVRALASAIGLTGGMLMLSDRVADLTLERLELAAGLLPPLPERALPTTYFGAGIPERVRVSIVRSWGAWLLVGLFNDSAEARQMRLDWDELGLEAGAYHAAEFWTGAYLGVTHAGTVVAVPPHGAAVVAVRAVAAVPVLVASSFHLSQGGVEIAEWHYDPENRRLRWVVALGRRASGTLRIALPDGLVPRRLVATARVAGFQRESGGLVAIQAEVENSADFALELEEP